MDVLPSPNVNADANAERHKRSFSRMSQQSTLSPSPAHNFVGRLSAAFLRNSPSSESQPSERRRLSHPHNPRRENMEENPRQQQRPGLPHQAHLTIDLTDDADEVPERHPRSQAPRQRRRPPHLGRSDASTLGNGSVIDLTDDDNDVSITSYRLLPVPRPASRPAESNPRQPGEPRRAIFHVPNAHVRQPPRPESGSPPLFVPREPYLPAGRAFGGRPSNAHHNSLQFRLDDVGGFAEHMPHFGHRFHLHHLHHNPGHEQMMPAGMDYGRNAFEPQRPPPRPAHVEPPPADEGFTRSPKEDSVVICPSCEEELVDTKSAQEERVVRKGGKISRKDMEEHAFWVLKECGHVYCNKCYQHRTPVKNASHVTSFREAPGSSKTKKYLCAVEDCKSDINAKDKWVGIFPPS